MKVQELCNSDLFELYHDIADELEALSEEDDDEDDDEDEDEGYIHYTPRSWKGYTERDLEQVTDEIKIRGYEDIDLFGKKTSALYYGNYATLEEYTASLNS